MEELDLSYDGPIGRHSGAGNPAEPTPETDAALAARIATEVDLEHAARWDGLYGLGTIAGIVIAIEGAGHFEGQPVAARLCAAGGVLLTAVCAKLSS